MRRTRRHLVSITGICVVGYCVASSPVLALDIVINPGPALAANPAAVAAFERATLQWERFIDDPITVTIDADFAPLDLGVIGGANPLTLTGNRSVYVQALQADSLSEAGDGVVGLLPPDGSVSAVLNAGFSLGAGIAAPKATLKAAGFQGLDQQFPAPDANITFSSNFAFDFDRSDGVQSNLKDFETVAVHEIGHALGIVSVVDAIDFVLGTTGGSTVVTPSPLDLFRFSSSFSFTDPTDAGDFASTFRAMFTGAVGSSMFDDLADELALSTGFFTGDLRQASHFQDDSISGVTLGVMDPTLADGAQLDVTLNDLRLLDVIGFDIEVLTGGLNGDGFVGAGDLDILLGNWNQNAPVGSLVRGDLNLDGFIGAGDLDVLLGNWNAGTPPGLQATLVPEPAVGMVVLGAAVLRRRR